MNAVDALAEILGCPCNTLIEADRRCPAGHRSRLRHAGDT